MFRNRLYLGKRLNRLLYNQNCHISHILYKVSVRHKVQVLTNEGQGVHWVHGQGSKVLHTGMLQREKRSSSLERPMAKQLYFA